MKTKHRLIVRVISVSQLIAGRAPATTPIAEVPADWQAGDRTKLEACRFQLTGSQTKDAALYLLKPYGGLPK
jgi:hypothetical protein